MKSHSGPKNYGSFADFEREELRPLNKVGFSVDDLESEAAYKAYEEQADHDANDELDFG
jgi:hypothetical protein